jgi:hypothetical protein
MKKMMLMVLMGCILITGCDRMCTGVVDLIGGHEWDEKAIPKEPQWYEQSGWPYAIGLCEWGISTGFGLTSLVAGWTGIVAGWTGISSQRISNAEARSQNKHSDYVRERQRKIWAEYDEKNSKEDDGDDVILGEAPKY